MIYTVTFNPSIDYIVNVDNFMTGVVNRTSKEIIFPGGKGINVSMVLKNLGEESTALGFMAGFTGDAITRLLQEKGVTADFIHVTEGLSRINVKLRAQTETEINGQGPKIASEDIRKLYGKLDALQDGDTLVLAGSIPDTMPESMYMDIMEHLQNKKLNIVVDATRDLLMNVLAYHPFLIKPNNHELGEIFHTIINDKDDVVTYAKRMQEKGARNVLVSMAGDGAVLVTEDGQEFRAEAPKGKLVNSVGAGDSMVAGFIYGSLNGMSVRTPISRQTSVINDHIRLFHGATAPSSILIESSGTSESRSTVRTLPVPPHFGQAPCELKASCSALGAWTRSPHSGQMISCSAATFSVGGT